MALKRTDRLTRFLPALFWAAAIFAFTMAVLPKPPRLPGDPADKVQHVIAFLTLAGLAASAYPRARLIGLALALSGFGMLIEIVQMVPALNRDAEFLDWAADSVAAALVLGIFGLVRARRKRVANGASDGARTRDLRRDRPAL